ncbi:replication initiation factor domain-containing protein [Carnobacterium divergens]|uniref:replication initiation factor domain-containing protein n=1 Tax=Carnobacterium divergens TaxID=2748 RepID=UPI00288C99FC|nr:replication initiation factor domain-containing protein [Carnobacterium divergens]MDT2010809.1 replication initiation factor domain-containing protein [Carnobacterium divergens]
MEKLGKPDELKKRRLAIGLKQNEVAKVIGISQMSISRYESGQREIDDKVLKKINELYSRYAISESKLEVKFDYFRMRFPTHDFKKIIKEVLLMDFDSFLSEDKALYGYVETYCYGSIRVMNSMHNDDRGILIQMSGEGCRNYDDVLETLDQDWKIFIKRCLDHKGSATRVDVALDDYEEIMPIPLMAKKIRSGCYSSKFQTYEILDSGNSTFNDQEGMTIYFGSKRSLIYFCFYQKNYEIAKREKILVEDVDVKNRYEIRMADEKARLFLNSYLNCIDFGSSVCGILAEYVSFYDSNDEDASMNLKWLKLLGKIESLDLKLVPKKPTIDSKVSWLRSQVSRTLKIVQEAGKLKGVDILDEVISEVELSENDEKFIDIATGTTEQFTLKQYSEATGMDMSYLESVMTIE